MSVYTLFGQPASPASLSFDGATYTLALQFAVTTSDCLLTGIWWYSAPGANFLPSTIGLYQVSNFNLIDSETASWAGSAGSGWVKASFTNPIALTASTQYKACVFSGSSNTGNWYSATNHYWDTGAGGSGLTNGPLTAPNSASTNTGQDSYYQAQAFSYPSTSFESSNYWVDVEITTTGGGGGGTSGGGVQGGLLMHVPV